MYEDEHEQKALRGWRTQNMRPGSPWLGFVEQKLSLQLLSGLNRVGFGLYL